MGNLCPGPKKLDEPVVGEEEFVFVPEDHRVEKIWDHFDLIKEMGQGASCRVLKVIGKGSSDQYAMKEMKRDDQWNPKLFQTEFDILSILDNPNIVQYREAWIDRNFFYIVNELCTGGELFERIRDNKKFNETKAQEILISIISAIKFCHSKNIVHRDLKPENIMYRKNSTTGDDELVIIDFGDAKKVEDDAHYNDFVGTAFYLPPEIVRNRRGWELKMSDMWSIGVIAFVLVTGRPPYYGTNHREILKKILSTDLKFPKKNTLSLECKEFISNLCEKKTKKRLTAIQALKHPFLCGESKEEPFGPEVLACLASYHSACLLKRVLVKLAADSLNGQRKELLIRCFNMIDINDDGIISVKELSSYLHKQLKFESSVAQRSAQDIVKEIGSKNESNITFSGFREGAISFDLGQKDQIQKTFQNISDGNEYVVVADLDKYFRHRVENKSLTQMLKEIDTDNDDKISFDEFSEAMQSPLRAAQIIRDQKGL